ncbi:choice-of-anchor J domain-containing protein [Empedobacter falsenii]
MKKFLFSLLTIAAVSANAQVSTIFEDSFETYTDFSVGGITATVNTGKIGDWTLFDGDKSTTYGFQGVTFPNSGKQMAFIVFNTNKTVPVLTPSALSDWTARTGDKAMVSFAATKPKNNDWLISPQIKLATSDNVVKFYAKAADANYGMEEFNVLVSTTDTNIASFTKLKSEIIDSDIEFAEYSLDLSAYNDKEIYIAIQSVSNDQFGFVVDDFSVSGSSLAVSDVNAKNITNVYPNPVEDSFKIDLGTSINKSKVSIELYDMVGKKVQSFDYADSYNISSLPKGTYVLRINDGTTKVVKKLVKK